MSVIKAGTEIRDEKGDLVATITRDCETGEIVSPDMFRMADGSTPLRGQLMPKAVYDFIEKYR